MLDLATRAHNHSYRIDPVLRSLLDTDFYKFLMLQFIWLHYREVPVTFSLINRTANVRLADMIPRLELATGSGYVPEGESAEVVRRGPDIGLGG